MERINNFQEKIFISIASFCDPLLWYTVDSAVRKSANPSRLTFSIIDQSIYSSNEHLKLSKISHVHYVRIDPVKSLGACWARHLAMETFDNQDYFLQIDSHTVFDDFWDAKIIAKYNQIKHASKKSKIVLSTRPMAFTIVDGNIVRDKRTKNTVLLKPKSHLINIVTPIIDYDAVFASNKSCYRGAQISAAFLFAHGSMIRELPYDPLIYFHGEEQNYSLRLFCAGWDIWHISEVPLHHLYKKRAAGEPILHWDSKFDSERDLKWFESQKRSNERLYALYKNQIDGVYGLQNVRSTKEFTDFTGIIID